jgi:NAD(P)-dependent dehydrogenase (short-subunit alcohol dehydrogenase family)
MKGYKDMATGGVLQGRRVLVIGRGSGLAYAICRAARDAGAQVIAAGRSHETLASVYAEEPNITTETVDVTDDESIAALGERLGTIDHIVSTASARARGKLQDLTRESVLTSFNTKVIGPLMLAKHLGPRINEGGSLVLFSGVAAFKIAIGTLAVAITNGAADTLTRSLALELAPVRVNAISPGVIDTGAWDALGEDRKTAMFTEQARLNPARRIGDADEIATAVMFALTNTFLTGVTLAVDGGEALT